MLNTCLLIDFIASKMNLDNYDRLSDPKKHVQNVRSSLGLVVQDSKAMCKVLSTTFRGLHEHGITISNVVQYLVV